MSLDLLRSTIEGVIRQPSANPQLTMVVLAIAVIALAIVVVLGLMLMPRRKRRVRKIVRRWVPDVVETGADSSGPLVEAAAPAEEAAHASAASGVTAPAPSAPDSAPSAPTSVPSARRGRARRVAAGASSIAIPVLIGAALVSGYAITGTDEACLTCHDGSPAVLAVHENDHAGRATCAECHEQGTGADVVTAVVARGEMALARSGLPTSTVEPRPVSSAACARCHDVGKGTIESARVNIRVSHAEPLAAGMNCVDCHGPVGHLGEAGRVPVSMDRCLGCHDGETASAVCAECHTTDIATVGRDALVRDDGRVTGSGRYQYPTVVASDADCSGCHDVATQCDPCHGLRLPHPESFVQGYHARDAAFEKKETCYRCHDTRDCQACHRPFSVGHAPNWKSDHTRSAWDAGCGCHGRGVNEDVPMCVFCHDNAPTQTVGSLSP